MHVRGRDSLRAWWIGHDYARDLSAKVEGERWPRAFLAIALASGPSGIAMPFNCGIVGLPNVGKSTIFNALTQTQAAQAANYPFCTIDPNTGMVTVPDKRLVVLQEIVKTERVIPTQLEIVDIAGLVKGASKGEGKGNEFLSAIKNVDAVLHVVRCFEDADVIHVDGSVDPVRDIEIIDLELLLKDEDVAKSALERTKKRSGMDSQSVPLASPRRS